MEDLPKVATEEEIKKMKRQCFCPNCKGVAFLRGWDGWKWCFKHWIREIREKDYLKDSWFYIKKTRIF
jgi:hypothetical protein